MRLALLIMLALGVAFAGCGAEPNLPPFPDAGGTNGNGTDDPDVCEPYTASDWGQTCSSFSPECPGGSTCRTVEGMGSTYGICSTECCGQNDADEAAHCPEVAPGLETCIILHVDDTWWCAVVCTNNSHCPEGQNQTCQPAPEASVSLCYPDQPEE